MRSYTINYTYDRGSRPWKQSMRFIQEYDAQYGEAAMVAIIPYLRVKKLHYHQELAANLGALQLAGVSSAMIAGGACILATYPPGRVLKMVKKLCQGSYEDFPPGVGPNWTKDEKAGVCIY